MIRPMILDDQQYITPLLCTMYDEHHQQIPHFVPSVNTHQHIQYVWNKIFIHEHYFHFVYEQHLQPIAYLGLSKQITNIDFIFPSGETLILDNIVVHPHHRQQGIATSLIEFAKIFATTQGFFSLDLYVLHQFPQTKKFYEKLQFNNISHYMSYNTKK